MYNLFEIDLKKSVDKILYKIKKNKNKKVGFGLKILVKLLLTCWRCS